VDEITRGVIAEAALQGGDEVRGAATGHDGLGDADGGTGGADGGRGCAEEGADVRLLADGGVGVEIDEAGAAGDGVGEGGLPRGARAQPAMTGDDELTAREVGRGRL